MNHVTKAIDAIREAVAEVGLPAFSQSAGVPYTTVIHWRNKDFRPQNVATLEKLAAAAERYATSNHSPEAPPDEEAA